MECLTNIDAKTVGQLPARQYRGFVHVLFLMLAMLGIVLYGVLGSNLEVARRTIEKEKLTPRALDEAKEALQQFAFSGGLKHKNTVPNYEPDYNYFYYAYMESHDAGSLTPYIVGGVSGGSNSYRNSFVVARAGQLPCPDLTGLNATSNYNSYLPVYFASSRFERSRLSGSPRAEYHPWHITDRDLDGTADYGDKMCSSRNRNIPALANDSRTGRLPWREYYDYVNMIKGVGNKDFRDGNNDRLWYTVARNVTDVTRPINPYSLIRAVDGWLTVVVDQYQSGSITPTVKLYTDLTIANVAAVVISPGKEINADRVLETVVFSNQRTDIEQNPLFDRSAYLSREYLDGGPLRFDMNVAGGPLEADSPIPLIEDIPAYLHRDELLAGFSEIDNSDNLDRIAIALESHYQLRGSMPDPATFESENAEHIARRLGRAAVPSTLIMGQSDAPISTAIQGAKIAYELSPLALIDGGNIITVQQAEIPPAFGVVSESAFPKIKIPSFVQLAVSTLFDLHTPLHLEPPIAELFSADIDPLVSHGNTGPPLRQSQRSTELSLTVQNVAWGAIIPPNTPLFAAENFAAVSPGLLSPTPSAGVAATVSLIVASTLTLDNASTSGNANAIFADFVPDTFDNLSKLGYAARLPAGTWLRSNQPITVYGESTYQTISSRFREFSFDIHSSATIFAGLARESLLSAGENLRLPNHTPLSSGSQGLLPVHALHRQVPNDLLTESPILNSQIGKGFVTVTLSDEIAGLINTLSIALNSQNYFFPLRLLDLHGAVGYFPSKVTMVVPKHCRDNADSPTCPIVRNALNGTQTTIKGGSTVLIEMPVGTKFFYPRNSVIPMGRSWFFHSNGTCEKAIVTLNLASSTTSTTSPCAGLSDMEIEAYRKTGAYVHLPSGAVIRSTLGGAINLPLPGGGILHFFQLDYWSDGTEISISRQPVTFEQTAFRIESKHPVFASDVQDYKRVAPGGGSLPLIRPFDILQNTYDVVEIYPYDGLAVGVSRILFPQVRQTVNISGAPELVQEEYKKSRILNPLGRARARTNLYSHMGNFTKSKSYYEHSPPSVINLSTFIYALSRATLKNSLDISGGGSYYLSDERGIDLSLDLGTGEPNSAVDSKPILRLDMRMNHEFDINPGEIAFDFHYDSPNNFVAGALQVSSYANNFANAPFSAPYQPIRAIDAQLLNSALQIDMRYQQVAYRYDTSIAVTNSLVGQVPLSWGQISVASGNDEGYNGLWMGIDLETDSVLIDANTRFSTTTTLSVPAGARIEYGTYLNTNPYLTVNQNYDYNDQLPPKFSDAAFYLPKARVFIRGGTYPVPMFAEAFLHQGTEGRVISPDHYTTLTVLLQSLSSGLIVTLGNTEVTFPDTVTIGISGARMFVPAGQEIPRLVPACEGAAYCLGFARQSHGQLLRFNPTIVNVDGKDIQLSVLSLDPINSGELTLLVTFASRQGKSARQDRDDFGFRFVADEGGIVAHVSSRTSATAKISPDHLRRLSDISAGQIVETRLEANRYSRIDLSWTDVPNGSLDTRGFAPPDMVFAQNNPIFYAVADGCRSDTADLSKRDCGAKKSGLQVDFFPGEELRMPEDAVALAGLKIIASEGYLTLASGNVSTPVDGFMLGRDGVPVTLLKIMPGQLSLAAAPSFTSSIGEPLTIIPPKDGGLIVQIDRDFTSTLFTYDANNAFPGLNRATLEMTVGGFTAGNILQSSHRVTVGPEDNLMLGVGTEIASNEEDNLQIIPGPGSSISNGTSLHRMLIVRTDRSANPLLSMELVANAMTRHFTGLQVVARPAGSPIIEGQQQTVPTTVFGEVVNLSGEILKSSLPGYAWQGLAYGGGQMTLFAGSKGAETSTTLLLRNTFLDRTRDPFNFAIPGRKLGYLYRRLSLIEPDVYLSPRIFDSVSPVLRSPGFGDTSFAKVSVLVGTDARLSEDTRNWEVHVTTGFDSSTDATNVVPIVTRQISATIEFSDTSRTVTTVSPQLVYAFLGETGPLNNVNFQSLSGTDLTPNKTYTIGYRVNNILTLAAINLDRQQTVPPSAISLTAAAISRQIEYINFNPLNTLTDTIILNHDAYAPAQLGTLQNPAGENLIMFSFGQIRGGNPNIAMTLGSGVNSIPSPFAVDPYYCGAQGWSEMLQNVRNNLSTPAGVTVTTASPVTGQTAFRSIRHPCINGLYNFNHVTLTRFIPDTTVPYDASFELENLFARDEAQIYNDQPDKFLSIAFDPAEDRSFMQIQVPVPVLTIGDKEIYNGSMIYPETGEVLLARKFSDSSTVTLFLPAVTPINPDIVIVATGNIVGASGLGRVQEVISPSVVTITSVVTDLPTEYHMAYDASLAAGTPDIYGFVSLTLTSSSASVAMAFVNTLAAYSTYDTSQQDGMLLSSIYTDNILTMSEFGHELALTTGNATIFRKIHRANSIDFSSGAIITIFPFSYAPPTLANEITVGNLLTFPPGTTLNMNSPYDFNSLDASLDISGFRFLPHIIRKSPTTVTNGTKFIADLLGVTVTLHDKIGGTVSTDAALNNISSLGVTVHSLGVNSNENYYPDDADLLVTSTGGFYQNLWIRVPRSTVTVHESAQTLTLILPDGTLINPVAGTYLPPARSNIDIRYRSFRLQQANAATLSEEVQFAPPALILPVGLTVRVGDSMLRFEDVRALIAHSPAPADHKVECGLAGGTEIYQATEGVSAASSDLGTVEQITRTSVPGVTVPSTVTVSAGSGHPCVLLDIAENSDLDRFFEVGFYGLETRLETPQPSEIRNLPATVWNRYYSNDQVRLIGGRPKFD